MYEEGGIMHIDIITGGDIAKERLTGVSFWTEDELPRIDDLILKSSIYLYPSKLDAQQGEKYGGSGFIVSVSTPAHPEGYLYAVTNSHVIWGNSNSPIMRINRIDGNVDILEYSQQQWKRHPDGDDLAVAPISLEAAKHKYARIDTCLFINQEIMLDHDIGAGDEVFIVGRFIGYDGKQQNEPTVRFGNLSLGKTVIVVREDGINQESFLVETRSLAGYSGSPIFLHILPFSYRPGFGLVTSSKMEKDGKQLGVGPWLLGIDYGHHQLKELVRQKCKDPVGDGSFVCSNSGITDVVPAWKLLDLLNDEEFVKVREKKDT
jgi:hypothetical protein